MAGKPYVQCPVIPDKKCDLCDKNDIEWKCLICDELLCNHCKIAHLRSKATKTHKVVDLKGANVRPTAEIRKCTEHLAENVQKYCKSCDMPICRKCITSRSHESHSLELIMDLIDKKKNEISHITVKSKEKLGKYEQTIITVSDQQRKFSDKISRTIKEVKTRNGELKDNLDKITEDLVKQLQQLEKQNQRIWKGIEVQVEEETAKLRKLIQTLEENKEMQSIDIVLFVAEMNEEFKSFVPVDPPNLGNPPEFMTKDVTEYLRALFGYLENISTAVSAPPLPPKPPKSVLNPEIYPRLVRTFTVVNTLISRVAAEDSDDAWVWSLVCSGISLVTAAGEIVQRIKTDMGLYDAAVSRSGELILAIGNTIKKVSRDCKTTKLYEAPVGCRTDCIAVTGAGNIIVGLNTNDSELDSKLVEMRANGEEIRIIQYETADKTKLFENPCSVNSNINGDILVVDSLTRVIVVDKYGHKRFTYEGQRKGLRKAFSPRCVVTDKFGHIIISDHNNSVVHMLDKDGTFLQFLFTEKDGCRNPVGLSIDPSGRLWVCNKTGNSIMIIRYI